MSDATSDRAVRDPAVTDAAATDAAVADAAETAAVTDAAGTAAVTDAAGTAAVTDPAAEVAEGGEPDEQAAVDHARRSHAVLRYTTLRLAIFLVALALLWLVQVRGALLVALALLVSGLASYALLQGQRAAVSERLATASRQRRSRAAARAAREDDIAEELARAQLDGGAAGVDAAPAGAAPSDVDPARRPDRARP